MTWYPEDMKRVDILVPGDRKEAVVRELKESGILELIDVRESDIDKGGISESYPKVSEMINLIEEALDSLDIVAPKKKDAVGKVKVHEEDTGKLLSRAEKKRGTIERIISMKEELKALGDRKAKLEETEKTLSLLRSLGVDPRSVSGHEFVSVFLGRISGKDLENAAREIDKLTRKYFLKTSSLDGDQMLMAMAVPKEFDEPAAKSLNMNGFDALKIPDDISDSSLESAKNMMIKEFGVIAAKELELKAKLKESLKHRNELLVLLELLMIEKKLDESDMLFGKTKLTNLISAWVPGKKLGELESIVDASTGNAYNITSRGPEKGETPPSVIGNAGPAGGLEIITKSYGLPSYNELDPTKFITLTFPFIFGMMFGDVGHGIMLFFAGLIMSKKLPGESTNKLGKTLMVCGIAAAFFGVLYGSAFGLTHEHHPDIMFEPLWMEPLAEGGKNITSFIKFSITLAVVVLSMGCILNIVNQGRHSLKHAFFHPWGVLGLWVLLAGANLFFSHGIDFISLTINGILGDTQALSTVFYDLVLLVVPLMLVPIGEIFIDRKPLAVGLYSIMEVAQTFLVNSISYVRIVIIAVVHGALLLMVLNIMNLMTSGLSGIAGSALAAIIFIAGNLVVFGMEAMIALVQTIRLHYYEFFSKFYRGSGRAFAPFRAERNYTVRSGK